MIAPVFIRQADCPAVGRTAGFWNLETIETHLDISVRFMKPDLVVEPGIFGGVGRIADILKLDDKYPFRSIAFHFVGNRSIVKSVHRLTGSDSHAGT